MSSEYSGVPLLLTRGQPRTYSYYCLSQKREFPIRALESRLTESESYRICTSCYGWLVFVREWRIGDNSDVCCLLDLNSPDQKEMRLPPIPRIFQVCSYTESLVMTAPPTASDWAVIVLEHRSRAALIWRPGQPNWTDLHLQGHEIRGLPLSMTVCNGRIYGVLGSEHYVACDIVESALNVTLLGPGPSDKYQKGCIKTDHLVGSGDDIFWVRLSKPRFHKQSCRVNSVDVFKVDATTQKWIRVESIGDRVFFLQQAHSFSYITTDSDVRTNCIHYICHSCSDHLLHTYDMESGNMEITDPCPQTSVLLPHAPLFILEK